MKIQQGKLFKTKSKLFSEQGKENRQTPTLLVVGGVVVVVAKQCSLHWVCLGLSHCYGRGVGHGGHGGCRQHQGRHVHTVTHEPESE